MSTKKVSTRQQPWRKFFSKKIKNILRSPVVYKWSVFLLHAANKVFEIFYKS